MAVAETARPLPGVVFEAEPPPSPRVLPRMDVAGFVGFAQAGPLDTPVPVEDARQFERVFGSDAPLAWDEERSGDVYAQLGPAVRAFFRNGGRRAWIVRVAGGDAERNTFLLPGLAVRSGEGVALSSAQLRARAVGSWADQLTVATALSSTPAVVVSAAIDRHFFRIELAGRSTIARSDLLRFRGGRYDLLIVAAKVDRSRIGVPDAGRTVLNVESDRLTALWLERIPAHEVAGAHGTARYTGADGRSRSVPARVPPPASPPEDEPDDERLELDVEGTELDAPQAGTLVHVDGLVAGAALWLAVDDIRSGERFGSPPTFRIVGRPSWVLASEPAPRPTIAPGDPAERLTFEAWTRDGKSWRVKLDGLGFAPGHPRYIGDLPTDEALYSGREGAVGSTPRLWAAAADPRFPLAAAALLAEEGQPTFYPLGMRAVPTHYVPALRPGRSRRERDGLADFHAGLFLDRRLRPVGLESLEAEANFVRWQSPRPRPLTGVHALLGIDEVTIVAIPDCVQRPWQPRPDDPIPVPPPHEESPPASPPEPPPLFTECRARTVPLTNLRVTEPDPAGSFTLEWDRIDEADAQYVLEESSDPRTWRRARAIYNGPALERPVVGRAPGTYFYRVRAKVEGNLGAWSTAVVVRVGSGVTYVVDPIEDFSPDVALAVHRAVLRLCAARGDLLGVLGTPQHYREEEAIAHARALRSLLTGSETRALGCGALYHPWLFAGLPERPEEITRVAPDGAAAGILSRRAATRGAWVAPANDPILDVVALTPPSRRESLRALQDAQVNEIRDEPDGFLCLSEDTLVLDEDLRPVNVRRLLSLLRRLALLHGADYVFEPNDPAFRRSVERGFDELLGFMYELGAFAGATAAEGYRVVVGNPPNTPQSVDQGRLIVELRVAPSRPLAFLVIRLIHAGDRGFALEAP